MDLGAPDETHLRHRRPGVSQVLLADADHLLYHRRRAHPENLEVGGPLGGLPEALSGADDGGGVPGRCCGLARDEPQLPRRARRRLNGPIGTHSEGSLPAKRFDGACSLRIWSVPSCTGPIPCKSRDLKQRFLTPTLRICIIRKFCIGTWFFNNFKYNS